MAVNSRRKGAYGELAAAELLHPAFPRAQRRIPGEESRGERLGVDLTNTPGYAVQVNVSKNPPVLRKFAEAAGVVRADERALVLVRKQSRSARNQPWLAVLEADELVRLLLAAQELEAVQDRARALLEGIDAARFTDSVLWEARVQQAFDDLADRLDGQRAQACRR